MRNVVKYTFIKDHGKFKKGDTVECHPSTKKHFDDVLKVEEEAEKPKRKRRTKAEIEADKNE
jgi:hypothetical protein